jgi:hypothetical protein
LLSLQKLPQEFLHADELTFQVVHQASERGSPDAACDPDVRPSHLPVARARNHFAL